MSSIKKGYEEKTSSLDRSAEIASLYWGGIVPVAILQFLGSLPFLYVCGISLWGAWGTHEASAFLLLVLVPPLCFSLLAVVTSIGLVFLQEWARRLTLFLSTAAAFGCALFLMLHHPKDTYGTPFAIRDPTPKVTSILLMILIPVSIWWWIFFTRKRVRALFRRD
jgi:hypothetical protein